MSKVNTVIYRATKGRIGGKLSGAPVLLLNHTGAKSGKAYTSPLMLVTEGDAFVLIASKGGMPHNPSWYHNLMAYPVCSVEVGGDRIECVAREVSGAERTALWDTAVEVYPEYENYQARTDRLIPVIVLDRIVKAS